MDPAVLQDRDRSSCLVFVTTAIQSNLLKWIALGPEREYPLRQSIRLPMFYPLTHVLYFTLCTNGTRQMITI